jgi:RNA exonuclease 4
VNKNYRRHHRQPHPPQPQVHDIVAMDCEMVGIGMDGLDSMLARVTIIDWNHEVIYDQYVKPQHPVIDYRTYITGITKNDLEENAIDFMECRRQVNQLIHNKIVVGHGLMNDFKVLHMIHPWYMIRDTAYYQPFMKIRKQQQHHVNQQALFYCPRKLKELATELLSMDIQTSTHSSIEDSVASLELYKLVQVQFEQHIKYQCMKLNNTNEQQLQQQIYRQQQQYNKNQQVHVPTTNYHRRHMKQQQQQLEQVCFQTIQNAA